MVTGSKTRPPNTVVVLQLDPRSAEAYTSLGNIRMLQERESQKRFTTIARPLRWSPNMPWRR